MNIKRVMGEKGQVVVPKDIREHLGIRPGSEVVFEVEEWAKTNMDDALYDQIENVGDLVDAIVYGKILPRENSVPAKSGWRRFIPPMHLRRAS